jgi:hypothetical protein
VLSRYRHLLRTLLPLLVLLAAQTALLLHQLDDSLHSGDQTCQVCLHAQSTTPAPVSSLADTHPPLVFSRLSPSSSRTISSQTTYLRPPGRAPPRPLS